MVQVSDNVVDEGQESFEIWTTRATYVYQKAGCGFSSLIDREANDWIGYHPRSGPKGNYRGIPNMSKDTFGHPGYLTGKSELVSQDADKAVIRSFTDDGNWDVEWSICSTHATMTAKRIGTPVWLLYEGTPGGKFLPDRQCMLLSDGSRHSCADTWDRSVPDPKWVAFCDPDSMRSLALVYEGPDVFPDRYWPMGGKGGMTVFGFGRTDKDELGYHIRQVPFRFTFALIESISYEEIQAYVLNYMMTGNSE